MTEKKDKSWTSYYNAVADSPPRPTLLKALECYVAGGHPQPGMAIDLGCGGGRDTQELLRQGWQVLAIDQEVEAVKRTQLSTPPEHFLQLTTQASRFEEVILSPAQLINGSFSLPFCPPQHFDALWGKIVNSLMPGGYFAGHLFGIRDEWAGSPDMNFHTLAEVTARFADFEIIQLDERDEDGSTATGKAKHWHIFAVVARRR